MPSYLTDVLGFDLESAGVLCIFPYIALFLCTLGFGYAFDYLQQQKNWKVRSIRMTAETIALAGSSLFLIICGFVDNKYAAYGFLILAQVLYVILWMELFFFVQHLEYLVVSITD